MRVISVATCCTQVLLAGCGTFPHLAAEPKVDVTQIVTTVECELKSALDYVQAASNSPGTKHWLSGWNAGIELELTSNFLGKNSAGAGLGRPLEPGTITLGVGVNRDDENEGYGIIGFPIKLSALEVCTPLATASVLTGYTGAGAWLARVGSAMDETGNLPSSIKYRVEFIVTRAMSGNPVLTALPVGSWTLGANITGSRQWKNKHKLTVTLTPPPPPEAATAARPSRPKANVPAAAQRAIQEEQQFQILRDLADELEDEVD